MPLDRGRHLLHGILQIPRTLLPGRIKLLHAPLQSQRVPDILLTALPTAAPVLVPILDVAHHSVHAWAGDAVAPGATGRVGVGRVGAVAEEGAGDAAFAHGVDLDAAAHCLILSGFGWGLQMMVGDGLFAVGFALGV